jgi:hypothetical protein
MVMNANLSFADWHKLRNLDAGMYGFFNGDPNQPENPAETTAPPRILQLNPGQPLFRWVHSKAGGSWDQKAAGPWWSTKRGAQQILERARAHGSRDTSEAARWYSSVARSWGSDLAEVVHVMVMQPIKVFMGVGRDIYDAPNREVWDSHGLQVYIPNMSEQKNGTWTLSRIAKHHLRIVWVKSSDEFEREMLDKAMEKGRKIAGR